VNAPASKTQLLAVLKLYGLNEGDLRLTHELHGAARRAREGTIDAGFIALSPYNPDLRASPPRSDPHPGFATRPGEGVRRVTVLDAGHGRGSCGHGIHEPMTD